MPDPKPDALAKSLAAAGKDFSAKEAGAVTAGCAAAAVDEKKRTELLDRIKSGKSSLGIEGDAKFQEAVLANLDTLSKCPTGMKLLSALDASGKKTAITESVTTNEEAAADFNAGLYDAARKKPGPGTDTKVMFNPERKKLNGEDWMTRDPALGLGHELIHALHDVNGTTDGRDGVEYTDAAGAKRKAPGYEVQTVGLGEHAGADITENKLRAEFKEQKLGGNATEHQRPRY